MSIPSAFGGIYGGHQLIHLTGICGAGPEMGEVDFDAGLPADLQTFFDAVAQMGAIEFGSPRFDQIDAIGGGHRMAQFGKFISSPPRAGIIAASGRKADGTLFQALGDDALGLCHIVLLHRDIEEADGFEANCAVGDEVGGVDSHFAVLVVTEGSDRFHMQSLDRIAQ